MGLNTRQRRSTGASKMNWIVAALALCAFVPCVHSAADSIEWCYHLPTCNDTLWPTTISPQFCNGSRQSPIDIVPANAKADSSLTPVVPRNFSSDLIKIENTGKTVKVTIGPNVGFSGAGLPDNYTSLQFHLHWGNGTSMNGSEHTLDGRRFPMELHIVNMKDSHNGDVNAALADSTGFVALGFFIDIMPGNATGQPASWQKLSSYLMNITDSGSSVNLPAGLSLDDLLVGVDMSKYYRYLGSLTTPACNEAVVWTVFKDTIKVSEDVINLFGTTVRVGNSSSVHAINTYRSIQPSQNVTTQPDSTSSASKTCFSVGLMALSLIVGRT